MNIDNYKSNHSIPIYSTEIRFISAVFLLSKETKLKSCPKNAKKKLKQAIKKLTPSRGETCRDQQV